jgi:hypothetical protein
MKRYRKWLHAGLVLLWCWFAGEAGAKAATDSMVAGGSRIKILDIGSADPLYSERFKYVGKPGTVEKSGLYNSKPGTGVYFSGAITLDDGKLIYPSQVSVEVLGSSSTSVKGTRYVGSSVKRGAWVRILDIGPSDGYYSTRGQIVGKICFPPEYELYQTSYTGPSDAFGGQLACLDGTSYYFSYVSVELLKASKFKSKPATGNPVAQNTRIKVVELGPLDASSAYLLGKEGYVNSGTLAPAGTLASGKTSYSGSVYMFDGSYAYFSQAVIEVFYIDTPGSLALGPGTIPAGTSVEIQAVGPSDGNYLSRHTLEGRLGVVGPSNALHEGNNGFYSGSISVDGKEFTFFQVSVLANIGGLPTRLPGKSLSSLPVGTPVRILDVSEIDTYAKDKALTVGRNGVVVTSPLLPSAGPWYSGTIKGDDGTYYYFSQVAVLPLDITVAKEVSGPKVNIATAASLSAGVELFIAEVGPSDANYAARSRLIGKKATATSLLSNSGYGSTSSSGGAYYSGTITVDGASYYVNQMAFLLVSP